MALTVVTVGIGRQVSTALYLSRYQRDRFKSLYLAKAGVNRAIAELENDKNSYDSLDESWESNEGAFKNIMFGDNPNEFAAVSYIDKVNGTDEIKYGVIDEERKININTASKETLISLLEKFEISSPQEMADNVLIWRGNIPDDNKVYENLGYPCKADKFSNVEELALVKDIKPEDLQRMKEFITLYTDGLVDINTVSLEALAIFTRGIAKKLSIGENFADSVAGKIMELRNSSLYFTKKEDIKITTTGLEETNIFNELMNNIVFQSNNFLIEVTGNAGKIKSKITAVYNRNGNKILYWHES